MEIANCYGSGIVSVFSILYQSIYRILYSIYLMNVVEISFQRINLLGITQRLISKGRECTWWMQTLGISMGNYTDLNVNSYLDIWG